MPSFSFLSIHKASKTGHKKNCEIYNAVHKNWKYYFLRYLSQCNEYSPFVIIGDPIGFFISCYRYERMIKSIWHNVMEVKKVIYVMHTDYKICSKLDINSLCSELFEEYIKSRYQD